MSNVRHVSDLGAAAYLLMHDYRPLGKRQRDIVFKCEDEEKFDELTMDYLASEFHRFDACIMSLKKIGDIKRAHPNVRYVGDLGAAAYVMMHKYRPVGKSGKNVCFEVTTGEGLEEFSRVLMEYLTSDFHRFDSCLMSLKKISDYSGE